MFVNVSISVCVVSDKNGLFLTRTTAVGPDNHEPINWSEGSYGIAAGVGGKLEISDALTKNSLAGPFNFGEGSLGPAQGGYSWGPGEYGEPVHVGSGGYSYGIPSGRGGKSDTWVSGYLFEVCGWWICNIGNSTK